MHQERLEKHLNEITKMSAELNMLRHQSHTSKNHINVLKKIKIKDERKEINENDLELIKLAEKYPANTKMQKYKMKMLKRNNLIDAESDSNKAYSSESYRSDKDIYKHQ